MTMVKIQYYPDGVIVLEKTGVGASNFLGVRRIFCPDFPKFARKTFLYKLSLDKFSVAVGTLHFPQQC